MTEHQADTEDNAQASRPVRARLALWLLAAALLATWVRLPGAPSAAAYAGGVGPGYDIDLSKASAGRAGVTLQSMSDPRWGSTAIGPWEDVPEKRCGCLLAVFSTLMTYYHAESQPWFPVTVKTPIFGEQTFFDFNPIYMHKYLYDGPWGTTGSAWGYKFNQPGTCGTLPRLWAFENVANPAVIRDEQGNVITSSARGFSIDYLNMNGLDAAGRDRIDNNLRNGIPTPVGIKLPSGGGHLELVVGWDSTFGGYLILDPAWPTGSAGDIPGQGDRVKYAEWERSVIAVLDAQKVYGPQTHISIDDDPSPIELLSISPDGRRTGYDPASGQTIKEDPATSYIKLGPWADPLGEIPPGEQGKFIDVRNPSDGTYRYVVTGTGDGRFKLDFTTVKDGQRTIIQSLDEPIGKGQTRKFELRYQANGQTTLREVERFTPDARAGNDVSGVVGTPVAFSALGSASLEGQSLSYSWDFGDGATASGATVEHSYATGGVYPVTLTATDARGARGTDTAVAYIVGGAGSGKATERVSVDSAGGELNGFSQDPTITPDGRYVVFASSATSLASGTDGHTQVYLHDRQTGATELVSRGSDGTPGDKDSGWAAVSADGRYVAFQSYATNLTPEAAGNLRSSYIYVRDRQTGSTEMVSLAAGGGHANGDSSRPAISADGRYVAFESLATDITAGDTNFVRDIYLYDRQQHRAELVSLSSSGGTLTDFRFCSAECGSFHPAISADGRTVAFESSSTQVVSGQLTKYMQVYVRDRQAGTTEAISVDRFGSVLQAHAGNPSLSADGRYVAFDSASNLVADPDANGWLDDVYVRDRQAGTTERVDVSSAGVQANFHAMQPAISPSGRYVAYYSAADNLVAGDSNGAGQGPPAGLDIFLFDREAHATERVSLSSEDEQALPDVGGYSLSGQQRVSVAANGAVAFQSGAANLVAHDENGWLDIFVRDTPGQSQARPLANLGGPYLGWADSAGRPASVRLDGSRSSDPSQGQAALTATWDFGDGEQANGAGLVATHRYAKPGSYTVSLTVDNGAAQSQPISTSVTILPAPPAEQLALAPGCAVPGQAVTVSGYALGANAATLEGGWDLSAGPYQPARVSLALPWSGTPLELTPSLPDFGFSTTVALPDSLSGDLELRVVDGPSASIVVPCPAPGNHAPQADAGGPLYRGAANAPLTLDGSGSRDPDGDQMSYTWYFGDGETGSGARPEHSYREAGEYTVTLIVSDGTTSSQPSLGSRSFALARISEPVPSDQTPPSTTAAASPAPNAAGWFNQDVTVALAAVDNPGGSGVAEISYRLSGAQQSEAATVSGDQATVSITAEGTTTLTFFSRDQAGNVEAEQSLTVKLDKSAPVATISANPGQLWPPNHKLVPVNVALNASDAGSGQPQITLLSVTSSEPDSGLGDGDTAGDIQGWQIGTADLSGSLRAERSGSGPGRVYTLTYRVVDAAGNETVVATTVTVPHDNP